MTDARKVLADADGTTRTNANGACPRVRDEGVDLLAAHLEYQMVADNRSEAVWLRGPPEQRIPEHDRHVPYGVDRIPLRPSVSSHDDGTLEGRVYGFAPSVAVVKSRSQHVEASSRRPKELPALVVPLDSDEIECKPLTKLVGSVTRYAISGGVVCDPLATQREVDHDGLSLHGAPVSPDGS